jgi:transcription elongation factor SPT5
MCQILSINHTSQTAKVKPLIQQIQHEVLEFPVAQLVKYVQVGDHVKVTDGRYAGETGTVVNVEEPEEQQFVAIVLTDNSAKEIQVFVRDVRVSTEVATGLDSLGGYEQGDLVMLGMTNVGVIINVGLEDFQVITQAGTLQTVRLQELHGKCNRHSANNVVLDSRTNHIQMNDMVNVEDGPHKGSSGTIKHIHRAYLFLHSNLRLQHTGIFVVRARHVVLAGSKSRAAQMGSLGAGGAQMGKGGKGAKGTGKGTRDELCGKTVKITRGLFKGYIGIVIEATGTFVCRVPQQVLFLRVSLQQMRPPKSSCTQRKRSTLSIVRTSWSSGTNKVNSTTTVMEEIRVPLLECPRRFTSWIHRRILHRCIPLMVRLFFRFRLLE